MTSYVGWIIGVVVLFVMFSTRNLFKDVLAIISKTIQEIIKLAVTAVSFLLKILSVIELYIVLLINIFMGNLKQSSVTRLLSIALVALSVASFYTTYTGMGYLIEGKTSDLIRICLTFGVQAIMLGASLMIGKYSTVRAASASGGVRQVCLPAPKGFTKGFKKSPAVLRVVFVAVAAIIYGIVYFCDLGRKTENFLYILGCLGLLICLGSVLPYIFSEVYRGAVSTILLIVYFSTLLVSAFFSYHTLLGTLYREEERNVDNVVIVAEEVSSLIEDTKDCFDEDYQIAVQERLLNAVDKLKEEVETGAFRGAADLCKIAESNTFETNQGTIQRIVTEYNGKTAISSDRSMEIEYYIRSVLGPDFEQEIKVRPGIQSFLDIFEYDTEKRDCIGDINTLLINLQKLEWEASVAQDSKNALEGVSNFMNKYISAKDRNAIDPNLRELSGLFEAVSVWKQFVHTTKDLQQELLSLNTASGTVDCDKSMGLLSQEVQKLLKSVPPYFPTFPENTAGSALKSDGRQISPAELSLRLQQVMRGHRSGLNEIERNLRAFVDTPQISLFAALIAALIDTLILFVGMLLPKMIPYFKDTASYGPGRKYTQEEFEENLDNLFNKPVRERDD